MLRLIIVRGLTGNCDSTCVVNIKMDRSGERDADQLEECAEPKALLKCGCDRHVLGLCAGKSLGGLLL